MKHPKMKYTYVGVDSHKETHYVVAIDCFFEKLGEIEFMNYPGNFNEALKEIEKLKVESTHLMFGLEDVSAYGRSLAVFLLNRKYKVKHVNASLVAHERKSRNVLHKTDSEDALCSARVLLNRFSSLPDANPQDKFYLLTNLVARRRLIVKMNTSLKNHIQSYIIIHYPRYNKFFENFDCKTSLLFYKKYPSPRKLQETNIDELTDFLEEHSKKRFRRKKAEAIFKIVKQDGDTSTKFQEEREKIICSGVRQLHNNNTELENIDSLLESFLDEFPYKLTSMSGIDTVIASSLIAEIGDIERFSTPSKLARYAGVSPVTYASGKSEVHYSNERGNRVLNSIFFKLSVLVTMKAGKNNKIVNSYFYEYYQRKISEGKTKKQALKCVQRRLVNIIWGMMKHKTEYINPPTQSTWISAFLSYIINFRNIDNRIKNLTY